MLPELVEGALELVFPTRCAGCELPGNLLCPACTDALPLIEAARSCRRCGAPLGPAQGCVECQGSDFEFGAVRAAGVLDLPLSRAVTVYKDAGERRLAPLLAGLVADAAGTWAQWADVVVAVPASRRALARRGFDHTALLARSVAEETGLPLRAVLSAAGKAELRGLGRALRRASVRDAFSVADDARVPSRVLLIDDVMTTGATLDAAAHTLLGSGASEVRCAVVARACRART